MRNFDDLPNAAMASDVDLAELFNVNRVTIWNWAKSGRLPAPKKLGPNTTRWNVGEVRAAIALMAA